VTREVRVAPRRAEDRPQRLAYPARDGRVATVSFAACHVMLQRPQDHRASTLPQTVAVNVVLGWEAHPPAGSPGRVVAGDHRAVDTVAQVLKSLSGIAPGGSLKNSSNASRPAVPMSSDNWKASTPCSSLSHYLLPSPGSCFSCDTSPATCPTSARPWP
jgi:hypothetical protein